MNLMSSLNNFVKNKQTFGIYKMWKNVFKCISCELEMGIEATETFHNLFSYW